jgi:hypothetical protein
MKMSAASKIAPRGTKSARRAGLIIAPSRVCSLIKNGNFSKKTSADASVFMAGALECLTSKIFHSTLAITGDKMITSRHVQLALNQDDELRELIRHSVISASGVVPFIHAELLLPASTKRQKAEPELTPVKATPDNRGHGIAHKKVPWAPLRMKERVPEPRKPVYDREQPVPGDPKSVKKRANEEDDDEDSVFIPPYYHSVPRYGYPSSGDEDDYDDDDDDVDIDDLYG